VAAAAVRRRDKRGEDRTAVSYPAKAEQKSVKVGSVRGSHGKENPDRTNEEIGRFVRGKNRYNRDLKKDLRRVKRRNKQDPASGTHKVETASQQEEATARRKNYS